MLIPIETVTFKKTNLSLRPQKVGPIRRLEEIHLQKGSSAKSSKLLTVSPYRRMHFKRDCNMTRTCQNIFF